MFRRELGCETNRCRVAKAPSADGNETGPNCLLYSARSADDHLLEPTAAERSELYFVSVLTIASTMIS